MHGIIILRSLRLLDRHLGRVQKTRSRTGRILSCLNITYRCVTLDTKQPGLDAVSCVIFGFPRCILSWT